jgi:shikimate kinase
MPADHVVLVGMMGVGKSTVGRLLAAEWSCPFEDTDSVIEAQSGRSVAQLFETVGESGFRSMEHEVLARLLAEGERRVISCGGGAVTVAENRALLAQHATVVWLTASVEVLTRRVGDGATRPLLRDDPTGTLRALTEAREQDYAQVADHVVDTTDRRPAAVARDVAEVVT